MTPTEHSPKTPSPRTSFFALLGSLLRVKGSGASKTRGGTGPSSVRRPGRTFHPFSRLKCCVPVLLCAVVGALAFTAAPALAAAPEAPATLSPAQSVTATTATLEGTLNPGAKAKAGWFFAYSTEIMCAINPLTTPTEAEEEVQAKTEKAAVTGLEPRKEYKFCLFATNEAGEATQSANEVSFTTPAAAPAVVSEATSGVKATEATLEAVLNPDNQTTTTTYSFEYSTKGKVGAGEKLEAPIVELAGGEFPAEAFGETPVGASTGAVLNQGTTYFYRVVAKYGASEEVKGKVLSFTTAIPPETPTATKVKPGSITATTVEVEGELNPTKARTSEPGSFEVLYKVSPLSEATTGQCEESATSAPTSGAKEEKVSEKLTGLQPNAKYTFCLRAKNEAGEEATGAPVTFDTPAAPPTIESESSSPVQPSESNPHPSPAHEIRLEGSVNPNNEPTECDFQYQAEEALLKVPTTVPCEPASFPAFFPGQGVALNVGGLEEGKTYYYRVVAKNAAGETVGIEGEPVKSFETALSPSAPEQAKATGITAKTATLNAVLNPGGPRAKEPGSDEFVYRQSSSECRYLLSAEEEASIQTKIAEARGLEDTAKQEELEAELKADRARQAENKATPAEAPPGLGEKEAAKAAVSELHPGAAYTYCLLVRNEAGEEVLGPAETFTALPFAPKIVGESAASVTATEATLNAQIEPNGATTTYHFEYGTTTSYEEPPTAPTELKGSLTAADTAEAIVKPLHPGTTYHYRVVATNEVGGKVETEDGPDQEFTTPETPTTAETCPNETRRAEQPYAKTLPDCRAYEMVSPVEAGGQDATDTSIPSGQARAALSGEEPAAGGKPVGEAITYSSKGSFAEPDGANFENQFLSRREPEHDRWSTRSITPPLEAYNTSLHGGYFGVFFTPELTEGVTPITAQLTPEAPEGLEELYLVGLADGPGSYRLVSHLPPSEEIYAPQYHTGGSGGVYPLGASADLGQIVFTIVNESNQVVGPLREWVNGAVVPVSVSNSGEPWYEATVGNSRPSGPGSSDVWRAVSEDGSRVVFGYSGELYVRVNAEQPQPKSDEQCTVSTDACTVKLGGGGASYRGANTEGTEIFYTENEDLYEASLPVGQVTPHVTALTSGGKVQGVVQISEDGSYVYFVAKAELKGPHGEPLRNSQGKEPVPGADNLYLSHGGAVQYIATLSAAGDFEDWREDPAPKPPSSRRARPLAVVWRSPRLKA